jgi:FkbM family methyltransferase
MIDPNRLTSKTRLGRLVRLPLALIPPRAVVRVRGGPNEGLRWRVGSSVHGCWLGTYERDKAAILHRFLAEGMSVWDVGANAGYYTLMFSRAVGPTGEVVAIEPFPANLSNLIDHVAWNAVGNTTVVAAAVGSRAGLAGFEPGPSNSMGQTKVERCPLMVPLLELDRLHEELGFRRPQVVKMDIEGAEVAALSAARSLLRNQAVAWFISLHGEEATRGTERILRDSGYSLFQVDGTPLVKSLADAGVDEIVATTREGFKAIA